MTVLVCDLLAAKDSTVWTVRPEDSVRTALQRMAEKDIGALPVVTGGRLVGILSERDVARRCMLQRRDLSQTPVEAIMTSSLHTVRPEHTLDRCLVVITNKHIRHLPVVDAAGSLIGILSVGDVLRAVIEQQRQQIQKLELYKPNCPEPA